MSPENRKKRDSSLSAALFCNNAKVKKQIVPDAHQSKIPIFDSKPVKGLELVITAGSRVTSDIGVSVCRHTTTVINKTRIIEALMAKNIGKNS